MAQYSQAANVAGTTSYPASPQIIIPFVPRSILIVNEHPTEPVNVSFDGQTDSGRLTPGVLVAVEWHERSSKIWFSVVNGATPGPVTVRVMAEDYG